MKYLHILLILLVGCSVNDTKQEKTYPFTSGNWLVYEDQADWIGEKTKSKAQTDTIYIEQPGDYDLEMWDASQMHHPHKFTLKLYTNLSSTDDTYNGAHTDVMLPGVWPDSECQFGCYDAMRVESRDGVYQIEFDFNYHCEDAQNNVVIFRFKDNNRKVQKVAQFNTNGFKEAVEEVANCTTS